MLHLTAFRIFALMAGLLLLVVSCSGVDDPAMDDGDAAASGEDADAGFPVTLEHVFGETTVDGPPQRVVALGVTDADVMIALGVTPVANAGYPFLEGGLGPWARELADEGELTFLEQDAEPDVELIASLEPDVITAVSSGIDEEAYELLSQIAPVIARPPGSDAYQVDRVEQTELIAETLGQAEAGQRLNDQVDDALADARAANPAFDGATAVAVLPFEGQYGAFLPDDARGQFLTSLGFVLPDAIAELDDGESFFVPISPEQVDLLESDLLIGFTEPGAPTIEEGNPLFDRLEVVRRDGVVTPTNEERGAITYNSVLSVPYALDALVPDFAAAIEATTQ